MNYDNNFTGILSKNLKKEKDTHPDTKGQCEVDGVEYWIAGWTTKRNDGTGTFQKLKFERKDAKPEQIHDKRFDAVKARKIDEDDSSIPF